MFFLTYANMDSVSSQVSGSSSVLAADWNTFVRDNFDDLKAGHVVLDTAGRLALGSPAKGTMVFDSTLDILMVFNGSVWIVGSGSSLTSTQKSGIPSPTAGTMVYDSTLGLFQFYSGSGWVNVQGSPPMLTTTQKNALGVVATGITVYDSTLGVFQRYTGSAWANAQGTPPLLTTAQKTALGTPATGTMVYDSTLNLIQAYNGTTWIEVANLSAGSSVPVGLVSPFAGAAAPTGYLLCNGAAWSRTTYAALWTALGTTASPYGQGDGSSTFNVPNLLGRSVVGAGTGAQQGVAGSGIISGGTALAARAIGAWFGDERLHGHNHTLTPVGTITGSVTAEAAHIHDTAGVLGFKYFNTATFGGAGDVLAYSGSTATLRDTNYNTGAGSSHTHADTFAFAGTLGTTSTSGSGLQQNLQPSLVLNYIIKH